MSEVLGVTGAGELTRLRWPDIDQVVPLLGPAWTLIESAPKLGEFILPYKVDSMLAAFERARNRIAETGMPGIKDLRLHDLHHTGISTLFWRGPGIPEVAAVSGHANWVALKRYSHIKPEDLHRHFDPKSEE